MKKIFSILFHALYHDKDSKRHKHPYLYISQNEFRQIIDYLHSQQFNFIDPFNIHDSAKEGKNVFLTFDDGYFNNVYTLDTLKEFQVKALFFFVKEQLLQQKLFWWDVYFINRIKSEHFPSIYKDIQKYKWLRNSEIENKFNELFGKNCFDLNDDLYRPMTIDELKVFSNNPFVKIGVHSASHEILTNCPDVDIKSELLSCKQFLEGLVCETITEVSYPNGNYNENIVSIAKELGFNLAFTTETGINDPEDFCNHNAMTIKRNAFPIPDATGSVLDQIKQSLYANGLMD